MDEKMTLYVDGAARGNPGPAGIAAILVDGRGREVFVERQYIGVATNNFAEYQALILGLTKAAGLVQDLVVCSDSELVVRQLNGEYKVKNKQLKDLVTRVTVLIEQFRSVELKHVAREQNVRADEEANAAIDDCVSQESGAALEAGGAQERLFDV